MTKRHSSFSMKTLTLLPASRWRPVTVNLVPPETGPLSGRTLAKEGLWRKKRRMRRRGKGRKGTRSGRGRREGIKRWMRKRRMGRMERE